MSEWSIATGKKSNKAKRSRPTSTTTTPPTPFNLNTTITTIRSFINILPKTIFYQKLLQAIQQWLSDTNTAKITEIIAYGIGSPSTSLNSLIQFACLLCLRTDLAPLKNDVSSYEPISNNQDHTILQTFNITNITTNEECRHSTAAAGTTLFYMPHCAHRMYSNVLWSNWNLECLSKVGIIGNSFLKYGMSLTYSKQDLSNCIALLSPHTSEIVLHDSMVTTNNGSGSGGGGVVDKTMENKIIAAFTDTSVMYYSRDSLNEMAVNGMLDTVPLKEPFGKNTTVWDQEMIRCVAEKDQTTKEKVEKSVKTGNHFSENIYADYNNSNDTLGKCFYCQCWTSPFNDSANPPVLLECAHAVCLECSKVALLHVAYIECHCKFISYEAPLVTGRPSSQKTPVETFTLPIAYFPYGSVSPTIYEVDNFKLSNTSKQVAEAVHDITGGLQPKFLHVSFFTEGRHFQLVPGFTLQSVGFFPDTLQSQSDYSKRHCIVVADGTLPENHAIAKQRIADLYTRRQKTPKNFKIQLRSEPSGLKYDFNVTSDTTFDMLEAEVFARIRAVDSNRVVVKDSKILFKTGISVQWNPTTTLETARVGPEKPVLFGFYKV